MPTGAPLDRRAASREGVAARAATTLRYRPTAMTAVQRAETSERILEGALHALGRHGMRKLGMSDVSESAGVSRGTLYRYYPSMEELLGALARYEQHRFETGLAAALDRSPAGPGRLNAVVRYTFGYLRDHPALERLLETEPAFVLQYLRGQLPGWRRATVRSLRPELEASMPVRLGTLRPEQVADLMIRVLLSVFLSPNRDPNVDAKALEAFVSLVAGTTTPRRSRARRTV